MKGFWGVPETINEKLAMALLKFTGTLLIASYAVYVHDSMRGIFVVLAAAYLFHLMVLIWKKVKAFLPFGGGSGFTI